MTTQLIKYEAACRALADCKAVDEVKAWADKAAAMQAYGRMAKDKTLEVDAAEIRIRAERRLGQMLADQKASGGLSKGAAGAGVNQHTPPEGRSAVTTAPRLADAGISKDLSRRAQKLAAVPEAAFEAELAAKRERDQREGARVSARLEKAGERELKKQQAAPAAEPEDDDGPSAADLLDDMQKELARAEARVAELEKLMQADGKKAAANLARRLDHAVRQQEVLQEDAARLQRKADRYERMLGQIGKAIGQPDLDRVVDAVRAVVRASKAASC